MIKPRIWVWVGILVLLLVGVLPYIVLGARATKAAAGFCASTDPDLTVMVTAQAETTATDLSFTFALTSPNAVQGATLRYGVYYLGPTEQTIFDADAPNQHRVVQTNLTTVSPTMLVGEGVVAVHVVLEANTANTLTAKWPIAATSPKGVYAVVPVLVNGIGEPITLKGDSAVVTRTDGGDQAVSADANVSLEVAGQSGIQHNAATVVLKNLSKDDQNITLNWNFYSGSLGTALPAQENYSAQTVILAGQSYQAMVPVTPEDYQLGSLVELMIFVDGTPQFSVRQPFDGSAATPFAIPTRHVEILHWGPFTLSHVTLCAQSHSSPAGLTLSTILGGRNHEAHLTSPLQAVSFWQWSRTSVTSADLTTTFHDTTRTYPALTGSLCGSEGKLCEGQL